MRLPASLTCGVSADMGSAARSLLSKRGEQALLSNSAKSCKCCPAITGEHSKDCNQDDYTGRMKKAHSKLGGTYKSALPKPEKAKAKPGQCKRFASGGCKNGKNCKFQHGDKPKAHNDGVLIL